MNEQTAELINERKRDKAKLGKADSVMIRLEFKRT